MIFEHLTAGRCQSYLIGCADSCTATLIDPEISGATGRTDLPGGDPEALFDSLFNRVCRLDPTLKVHPAHE